MLISFEQLIKRAREIGPVTIAVGAAADEDVISAVAQAKKAGVANAVLVGDRDGILQILKEQMLTPDDFHIEDVKDPIAAARRAVEIIKTGAAQILMKGFVNTADLMRAVLDKQSGLGVGTLLSHITVFEPKGFQRLMLITDAAINILPDLDQKVKIIRNAIIVTQALGITRPKVAILAAVETVNASMVATTDAAMLSKMADRGQLKGCLIDGPLALDNAVSEKAAHHKGISGEVPGHADILVVPNIEAGNMLYKSLVYFADLPIGGIVIGASVPVVLTSRSDSPESKMNSIALAAVTALGQPKSTRK